MGKPAQIASTSTQSKESVARKLRSFSACLFLIALTACGGGSKGSDGGAARSESGAPPSSAGQSDLESHIANLEASGKLPILDRSDDLLGPDLDGNGVRDDIDRYISGLALNEKQKRAAVQVARVYQHALTIDPKDNASLDAHHHLGERSDNCLMTVFDWQGTEYIKLAHRLRSLTFNTRKRTMHYLAVDRAYSGESYRLEEFDQDTCE